MCAAAALGRRLCNVCVGPAGAGASVIGSVSNSSAITVAFWRAPQANETLLRPIASARSPAGQRPGLGRTKTTTSGVLRESLFQLRDQRRSSTLPVFCRSLKMVERVLLSPRKLRKKPAIQVKRVRIVGTQQECSSKELLSLVVLVEHGQQRCILPESRNLIRIYP